MRTELRLLCTCALRTPASCQGIEPGSVCAHEKIRIFFLETKSLFSILIPLRGENFKGFSSTMKKNFGETKS